MAAPDTSDPRALLDAWLARRGPVAEVVETHVSLVAFQGDRAYKLKKPVRFEFLDLSTPERRAAACHQEVELNRRLAPDVYLGVVDVTADDGRVVDHAVLMRRMPADRRLATLAVVEDRDAVACTRRVARRLAAFHERARRGPDVDAAATRDAVAELWELGIAETSPFVGTVLDEEAAAAVTRRARRYLAGRAALFDERLAAGRAVDGHGDLLADDVFCLRDGPRILDCLEFDDRLRFGDTLADAAFLAMDLEHLGRADLARGFLDEYRDRSGDSWPASLEHLYVAYRAHVRAKVACLRHAQGDDQAAVRARALLDLARRHLDDGRVRLVIVGGLPGTGKSTVAAALADRPGWVLLRSDVERKARAGLSPTDRRAAPLDEGLYAPARTDATYAALLDAAAARLRRGSSVVVDASWSAARHRRAAAATAAAAAAALVPVCCTAPRAVAAARVTTRAARGDDASDATPTVADAMAARFDDWPEARRLDTDQQLATTLAQVRRVVDSG